MNDIFVGREEISAEIRRAFLESGRNQAWSLYGLPGIGKTTLVQHSLRDLPEDVVAVHISLYECADTDAFWREIVRQIRERVAPDGGGDAAVRTSFDLVTGERAPWRRMLRSIKNVFSYAAACGVRILLIVDDWDDAVRVFRDGTDSLGLLKTMVSDADNKVSVLLLSRRPLKNIDHAIDPGLTFHSVFRSQPLQGFNEQEMEDYWSQLGDYSLCLMMCGTQRRLSYYAGCLPYLLSLFAGDVIAMASALDDIDEDAIDRIYDVHAAEIHDYYDKVREQLVADGDWQRIVTLTAGPRIGVSKQDENDLINLGYLRREDGDLIAISGYYMETNSARQDVADEWAQLDELSRRLRRLLKAEARTLCDRYHIPYDGRTFPARLLHQADIPQQSIAKYDRRIANARNQHGEAWIYPDVIAMHDVIRILYAFWDGVFARYLDGNPYDRWKQQFDLCAKVRDAYTRDNDLYLSRKDKEEADLYCTQILEVLRRTMADIDAADQAEREAGDAVLQPDVLYERGRHYYYAESAAQDYEEARRYLEKAAELGVSKAYGLLGAIYYHGYGVTRDYAMARRWYERAARNGDVEAFRMLGTIYQNGYGVTPDPGKALEYYEPLAQRGDAQAQYAAGCILLDRVDAADVHQGMEYLESAAGQGDVRAHYRLGVEYRKGGHVERDENRAVPHLLAAAEAGNPEAQYDLGDLYLVGWGDWLTGEGTWPETEEALKWYEQAAAQGHVGALQSLGMMYYNGFGTAADRDKAYTYYKAAADKGNAEAQYALHTYYLGDGPYRDVAMGIEYLEQAAGQGHREACYELGRRYYDGEQISKDEVRALTWFEQAAEKGVREAEIYIADLYDHGPEEIRDYEQALRYYNKAADQGNGRALCAIGDLYHDGHGVPVDYDIARKCYEQAVAAGYQDANWKLAYLYVQGDGVEVDVDRAYRYSEVAADAGNATAQYYMYVLCTQIKKYRDVPRALQYLQQSAAQGNAAAYQQMGEEYYLGKHVRKNDERALQYYEAVAEQGDAESQYYAGEICATSETMVKNYDKAAQWLLRAAESDDTDAIALLGFLYYKGLGVPENKELARQYLTQAADRGHALAAYNLFSYYVYSDPDNIKRGLNYLEIAWKAGLHKASFVMARMYYDGDGVDQNYFLARIFFSGLAKRGYAAAQYYMGEIRYHGQGVPVDYDAARRWFERAAEQDHAPSITELGNMQYYGHGVDADEDTAVRYYARAAAAGDQDARIMLNRIRGVEEQPTHRAVADENFYAFIKFAQEMNVIPRHLDLNIRGPQKDEPTYEPYVYRLREYAEMTNLPKRIVEAMAKCPAAHDSREVTLWN